MFAEQGVDRLSSVTLASLLAEIETSPWGDLWGKRLDARGLARRLKPFAIKPRSVRLDDGATAKGYLHEQFTDAFGRYLSETERHTVATRTATGIATNPDPPHVTHETPRDLAFSKRL